MSIGQGNSGGAQLGGIKVVTTSNEGLSVDYWTDRLLERIVYVAEDSDSVIKEQALAFKAQIRAVIFTYITHAIKSDRTTLHGLLLQKGEPQLADIIRRLN